MDKNNPQLRQFQKLMESCDIKVKTKQTLQI